MKRGLIIFKGKYGATRQYAQWLGQQLDLPYLDADKVTGQLLSDYDFVILGCSVYYGKLLLSSFISEHLPLLKAKKLFIYIVCATPETDEKKQNRIVKENIPKPIAAWGNIFFLPGRLVPKALGLADRIMLRLAAIFEKDPSRKLVMLNGIDGVDKDNLIDIVIAVTMYSQIKTDLHPDTKRSC